MNDTQKATAVITAITDYMDETKLKYDADREKKYRVHHRYGRRFSRYADVFRKCRKQPRGNVQSVAV